MKQNCFGGGGGGEAGGVQHYAKAKLLGMCQMREKGRFFVVSLGLLTGIVVHPSFAGEVRLTIPIWEGVLLQNPVHLFKHKTIFCFNLECYLKETESISQTSLPFKGRKCYYWETCAGEQITKQSDFIPIVCLKADLHGTTLSHAINLRQVYDMNRSV